MSAKKRERSRKRRIAIIVIVGFVALALLAGMYLAALYGYGRDVNNRASILLTLPSDTSRYMKVDVKVVSVNLPEENMDVRVGLTPEGSLADNEGELT